MRYFRNSKGDVFGFDETDKSQIPLIKKVKEDGLTEISDRWPPPPSATELLLRRIGEIEATITPRRIREAVTGQDGGWLKAAEDSIKLLRVKLK